MANKILGTIGTAVSFSGDAGADVAGSWEGVGAGDGQVSARYDLGDISVTSREVLYEVRYSFTFATTPVLNEVVRIYMITSDGTFEDSDMGTADAAVTTEAPFNNAKLIETAHVAVAGTGTLLQGSTVVEIWSRYVSFGVWNATADAFSATDTAHDLLLTPLAWEVQ